MEIVLPELAKLLSWPAGKATVTPMTGRAVAHRDAQRARLYAAERAAFHPNHPPDLETIEACARYVRRIEKSKTWRTLMERHRGMIVEPVVVEASNGDHWSRGHIRLSRWGRRRWVVLHELAHHVAPPIRGRRAAHGREFCSVYLALVSRFLGRAEAKALREAMRGRRVKWRGTDRAAADKREAKARRPKGEMPEGLKRWRAEQDARECCYCGAQGGTMKPSAECWAHPSCEADAKAAE